MKRKLWLQRCSVKIKSESPVFCSVGISVRCSLYTFQRLFANSHFRNYIQLVRSLQGKMKIGLYTSVMRYLGIFWGGSLLLIGLVFCKRCGKNEIKNNNFRPVKLHSYKHWICQNDPSRLIFLFPAPRKPPTSKRRVVIWILLDSIHEPNNRSVFCHTSVDKKGISLAKHHCLQTRNWFLLSVVSHTEVFKHAPNTYWTH